MASLAEDRLLLFGGPVAEFRGAHGGRRVVPDIMNGESANVERIAMVRFHPGCKAAARHAGRMIPGPDFLGGLQALKTRIPLKVRRGWTPGFAPSQGCHFARNIENFVADTLELGLLMPFGIIIACFRHGGKDAERLSVKSIVVVGARAPVTRPVARIGSRLVVLAAVVDYRKRRGALISRAMPSRRWPRLPGPRLRSDSLRARSTMTITPRVSLHNKPQPATTIRIRDWPGS
jgi:hypothetical protein